MRKLFFWLIALFFITSLLKSQESIKTQSRNYGSPASLFESCIRIILNKHTEDTIPVYYHQPIREYEEQLEQTREIFETLNYSVNRNGELIKQLLHSLANPNARHEINGSTPLVLAIRYDSLETTKLLLEYGASINLWSKNLYETTILETPLLAAIYWRRKDLVMLLLDHNADVNAQDNQGTTPLIKATQRYLIDEKFSLETIKLLLKYKADRALTNSCGQTALEIAIAQDYTPIINMLNNNYQTKNFRHYKSLHSPGISHKSKRS